MLLAILAELKLQFTQDGVTIELPSIDKGLKVLMSVKSPLRNLFPHPQRIRQP